VCFYGSATRQSQRGAGPCLPKTFRGPTYAKTIWPRATKLGPREAGQSVPKIYYSPYLRLNGFVKTTKYVVVVRIDSRKVWIKFHCSSLGSRTEMCTHTIFPLVAIKRWQLLLFQKFIQVVQKRLGTNKFVRTKSHTGSTFSKISLVLLYRGGTVVVHPYFSLLCHSRAPISESHVFVNFVAVWGRMASVNYGSIWTLFPLNVRELDVFSNALNVSLFRR